MSEKTVTLLSGGAAQGLLAALAAPVLALTGFEVRGEYSAVGAMKDRLLAGAPADLVILTRALVDELAAGGHVLADSRSDLGVVRTGIAVQRGAPRRALADAADLRALLRDAPGIFFPDPQRATAGIHFMKVLDALGLSGELAPALRTYPNGSTAMRALARADGSGLVGCTQITEILATDDVVLAGPLPAEFELATVYTAAVCTRAAQAEAARSLVRLLGGEASAAQRRRAGFEF